MSKKARVLVVDDDDNIRKVVKAMLEKSGFKVETASNTIGAGYLLKDFDPDLVVLDIMLPGSLAGNQACDALREFRPDLKIVFFSGIDDEALKKLGEQHCADCVVSKSNRISTLIGEVERLLRPEAG